MSFFFFFSSRRRHTRLTCDWSSDVCSSDLTKRNGDFCKQTIPPGLWRTKSLRQIAETAPYFRDGQAATLDDVIEFYDRGGDPEGTFLGGPKEIKPLHLSAEEKNQLKAFLKTLTGEPVPERFLRDLHNK